MTYNVEATKDGINWITVATGYKIKNYANSLAWILVSQCGYKSSKIVEVK